MLFCLALRYYFKTGIVYSSLAVVEINQYIFSIYKLYYLKFHIMVR